MAGTECQAGAHWSVGDGVLEAGWAHQAGFMGQSEGFGFLLSVTGSLRQV